MNKLSFEEWKNSKYSIPDIVLEALEKEAGQGEIERLLQTHYKFYLKDYNTNG